MKAPLIVMRGESLFDRLSRNPAGRRGFYAKATGDATSNSLELEKL
jgi:hypothetical protein